MRLSQWLPARNAAGRRLQEEPPTEEDCGSSVVQFGDGVCDDRLNNEPCKFDGGDCCAQTCVLNPLFGSSCLFFNCTDPSVGADVSVVTSLIQRVKLDQRLLARPSGCSIGLCLACAQATCYQVIKNSERRNVLFTRERQPPPRPRRPQKQTDVM